MIRKKSLDTIWKCVYYKGKRKHYKFLREGGRKMRRNGMIIEKSKTNRIMRLWITVCPGWSTDGSNAL